MSNLTRRLAAVTLALAVTAGATVALAPGASAATNPSNISCSIIDSGCKSAKAWYEDFWDYGIAEVPYSEAGTTAARDGLRVMAAMAVGNAIGGTGSGLLDNIDAELGQLYRTRAGMACAKGALYDTADAIRKNREAISNMRTTFSLMKKAAGKNKTLKAYAEIGKAAMDTADRLNQRVRAEELYRDLMSC